MIRLPYNTREVFDVLASTPIDPSGLLRAETDIIVSGSSLSFFRDHLDEFGLLIPCTEEEFAGFSNDKTSRNIHVIRTKAGDQYLIKLSLKDKILIEQFIHFLDNLVADIEQDPSAALAQMFRHLTRWRRLFERGPRSTVELTTVAGVLCEMLVLDQLLEEQGDSALDMWTGPLLERHDFELPDMSVECKATLNPSRLEVTFHGEYQLLPDSDKPLLLHVARFEPHDKGDLSLQVLFERICQKAPFFRDDLIEALVKLGVAYDIITDPDSDIRFKALDHYEFDVIDDFPRVTLSQRGDRIIHVQFTVDLADPDTVPGYRTTPRFRA